MNFSLHHCLGQNSSDFVQGSVKNTLSIATELLINCLLQNGGGICILSLENSLSIKEYTVKILNIGTYMSEQTV